MSDPDANPTDTEGPETPTVRRSRRGSPDRAATLHDVAARVGVSPRTVSRVVNEEGGFSENTRERVLEAVKELGYRPNMLARGLITRRSGTVALVGHVADPLMIDHAAAIVRRLAESGRTTYAIDDLNSLHLQIKALETLLARSVDGVVVGPVPGSSEQLVDHARRGLPVVVCGTGVPRGPNIAHVQHDLGAVARLGFGRLAAAGRRRIGMILSTLTSSDNSARERGFRGAADSGDVQIDVVRVEPSTRGGADGLRQLLDLGHDIDGIFAYNDYLAIGAISEAAARGVRVPDDLSILGVGDVEFGALYKPALTTIRLDGRRLAQEIDAALEKLIGTPGLDPEPVVVPVELVERESVSVGAEGLEPPASSL